MLVHRREIRKFFDTAKTLLSDRLCVTKRACRHKNTTNQTERTAHFVQGFFEVSGDVGTAAFDRIASSDSYNNMPGISNFKVNVIFMLIIWDVMRKYTDIL